MRILTFSTAVFWILAQHSAGAQPAAKPAPQPEMYTELKPEAMASILQNKGYGAQVYEFGGNNKKQKGIKTGISGYKVYIYFYNCDPDSFSGSCRSLNFEVAFNKSAQYTLALANQWNASKRFTKLYIDPKDGTLTCDFDFDLVGGVTLDSINNAIDLYDRAIASISKFVDDFQP
jgi:hypothetical protein